ncbi:MAG TPA: methyltransferase [Bryobacteraceae bacterium]|nr:methyltransferase [Bryobacteraceae bacterium]
MSFPKVYADLVARFRVPSGFLLLAAFVWLAAPTAASLAWGLPLSIVGLAIRAWAAGHLEKDMALAESGPYAWVRNPLYLGTLTIAAGFVVASRRWELALLFAAVFALVYLPVVELEEQHLANLFPAFASYKGRVPKLVPRPPRKPGATPFRWSVYRRNEEYRALAGFLLSAAVLLWKVLML